jgi:hypothetical protein
MGRPSRLISLFAQTKAGSIKAGEVAFELKPPQTVEDAITLPDRLVSTGQIPPREWMRAKETARQSRSFAMKRIERLSAQLHEEIGRVQPSFHFSIAKALA